MSLDKLVTDIKKEHEQVGLAMRKSIQHARKAGELLTKAKAEVDKGETKWSFWVKNRCGIAERMAANYIRIFKDWAKIEAKVSQDNFDLAEMTIRAALSLLKKRTRKAKEPLTLPALATLMDEFGIQGDPEKLVEMLKTLHVKLAVAELERKDLEATA